MDSSKFPARQWTRPSVPPPNGLVQVSYLPMDLSKFLARQWTRPKFPTCQWTRPNFGPSCPVVSSTSSWPPAGAARQTARPPSSSRGWPRDRTHDHDFLPRRRAKSPADWTPRPSPAHHSVSAHATTHHKVRSKSGILRGEIKILKACKANKISQNSVVDPNN